MKTLLLAGPTQERAWNSRLANEELKNAPPWKPFQKRSRLPLYRFSTTNPFVSRVPIVYHRWKWIRMQTTTNARLDWWRCPKSPSATLESAGGTWWGCLGRRPIQFSTFVLVCHCSFYSYLPLIGCGLLVAHSVDSAFLSLQILTWIRACGRVNRGVALQPEVR